MISLAHSCPFTISYCQEVFERKSMLPKDRLKRTVLAHGETRRESHVFLAGYLLSVSILLVGGLEHLFFFMTFHSVGNNHPNWRSHIFRRGRYTTNQIECTSRFSFLQEVFEQLGLGFSAIVWCALICRQGLLPLMQIGVRVFRCWVCSDTCRHQRDMRGDVSWYGTLSGAKPRQDMRHIYLKKRYVDGLWGTIFSYKPLQRLFWAAHVRVFEKQAAHTVSNWHQISIV